MTLNRADARPWLSGLQPCVHVQAACLRRASAASLSTPHRSRCDRVESARHGIPPAIYGFGGLPQIHQHADRRGWASSKDSRSGDRNVFHLPQHSSIAGSAAPTPQKNSCSPTGDQITGRSTDSASTSIRGGHLQGIKHAAVNDTSTVLADRCR